MLCTIKKITPSKKNAAMSWLTVQGIDGIFVNNYLVQVTRDHGKEIGAQIEVPSHFLRPIHTLDKRA